MVQLTVSQEDKKAARVAVSSEDLVREGYVFKLSHVVIGRPHSLRDYGPQVSMSPYTGLSVAAWLFSQHFRWPVPINWGEREQERERKRNPLCTESSVFYAPKLGNGLASFLPYATGHREQNQYSTHCGRGLTRIGIQLEAMLEAAYHSITTWFGQPSIFHTIVFTWNGYYVTLKYNLAHAWVYSENMLWKGFCEWGTC